MKTLSQALAEWRRKAESARGTRLWEHDETHILECSPERVLALLAVAEAARGMLVVGGMSFGESSKWILLKDALAALAQALDAEVRT